MCASALALGSRATSLILTVVSAPDGKRMWAYSGFAWRRVAGVTGASNLLRRVWFLTNIGPGLTQDRMDLPAVDLRE